MPKRRFPPAPNRIYPSRRELFKGLMSYTLPRGVQEIIDQRVYPIIRTAEALVRADGTLNPTFLLNLTRACYMQGVMDGKQVEDHHE